MPSGRRLRGKVCGGGGEEGESLGFRVEGLGFRVQEQDASSGIRRATFFRV